MFKKRQNSLLALQLCIPLIIFYSAYLFNHSSDLRATGFIQYDNVSYIAFAKQYLDADSFHLQYSNPFNDQDYTPMYFQPQTIFFAFLLKLGVPAGWILIPVSLFCSFICFRIIIALYDLFLPQSINRLLGVWLFAWGGGVLAIAGGFASTVLNTQADLFGSLFILDPEYGWWGLNLGRSLLFTCEAYYHALFLGCIYCTLKRKWIFSAFLLITLSLSHPFTGIELICIICLWSVVELFINKSNLPLWFLVIGLFTLAFHLYFYLVYLNQFPEHKSVSDQYTLAWKLRYYRMIPAYFIVGCLAFAAMYTATIREFLKLKANRLFVCWFIVAFLLANHEIFITARQPIHFTRGYIWTSLFLLGLPALESFLGKLRARFGKVVLVLFSTFFLMDNFLWFLMQSIERVTKPGVGHITSEQRDVLGFLSKRCSNNTLIITADETIAYLSSIYTKGYPLYSHMYTTPFAKEKKVLQNKFFVQGVIDNKWLERETVYVLRTVDTVAIKKLNGYPINQMHKTTNYIIAGHNFPLNFRER